MNTKIEELKIIQELFDKISNEDKNRLNTLLLTCIEEYAVDPLETIKRCIQEMVKQEMVKQEIGKESSAESVKEIAALLPGFTNGRAAREGRNPLSSVSTYPAKIDKKGHVRFR